MTAELRRLLLENTHIEVLEQTHHSNKHGDGFTYNYELRSKDDSWVIYGDLKEAINHKGYEVLAVRPSDEYDNALHVVLKTIGNETVLKRYEEELENEKDKA